MSKEYNVEAIETKNETKGCSSCKRGLNNTAIWTMVLSVYMLVTSIYGTIKLFKSLISLFQ
jgi:hypothetical protein